MSVSFMTAYVLIWPLLVAAVLAVIGGNFVKDWREARAEGRGLV